MLMASKLYSSATQIMSTPAASRSLARWAALRGSPVYATDVDSFTPPSLHALWHGDAVTGDFSIVTEAGVVGFLDARSHLGTIEARADGSVVAVALLDGVLLDPGAERRLDPLWIGEGDSAGPLYSAFAAAWGATAGARIPEGSVAGWCSWYQYFDRVTPDDIRDNLDLAVRHGIDLVQIDDGYQH